MIASEKIPLFWKTEDARSVAVHHSERAPVLLRFALYLFAFAVVFESLNLGITSDALSFAKIVGYGFFLTTLAYPRHCYSKPPQPFGWFVAYLFIAIVVGAFTSAGRFMETAAYVTSIVQLLILFWACANLYSSDRQLITETLWIIAGATFMLSVLQVSGIMPTTFQGGVEERGSVMGMNANEYALILVLGVICLTGFAATYRELGISGRAFLALACLPLAYEIVETGSRGAMLSLVIGLVVLPISMLRSKWSRARSFIAVLAVLGIVYFYSVNSPTVVARWGLVFERGDLATRERIYPAAIQMVIERPFFGWGPVTNTYELGKRVHDYGGFPRDTHNLLLFVLTQVGILGSIPFLVGITQCTVRAWKSRSLVNGPILFALLCSLIAITVSGTLITFKLLWIVMAFSAGNPTEPPEVGRLPHLKILMRS
jgi:O-antigen ligase